MKPLHDWLLIKELDQSFLKNSEIADPDWFAGLNHKMLVGKVVAAGKGREACAPVFRKNGKVHPTCIKPGQIVMFDRRKRELDRRRIDGDVPENCFWVRERDIDLVLE